MGLQIFFNNANGAASATPLGGTIAESGSPVDIYKLNVVVSWQFGSADLQGIYRPLRKPDMTTFAMNFLPEGTFQGTATFGIDPATVARPVAGTGTGYLVNQPPGYAVGDRKVILDSGSGTILAGDYVDLGHFEYLVGTGLAGGFIILAEPGLREVIPDDTEIFINTEAGFYTALLEADTTAGRTLLGSTGDAIPMNGQLTWYEPGDDTMGPPRSGQRIYATYLNTFDFSGVSPSIVTPGFTFLLSVTGITGGGLTNLDGIPTVGKGYNVLAFVDATSGYLNYQLRAGTDATSAPAIVRAADYGTGYHFVWYSV